MFRNICQILALGIVVLISSSTVNAQAGISVQVTYHDCYCSESTGGDRVAIFDTKSNPPDTLYYIDLSCLSMVHGGGTQSNVPAGYYGAVVILGTSSECNTTSVEYFEHDGVNVTTVELEAWYK